MGHPVIDNETPFSVEPLFLSDEAGRPLLVTVVKATYALAANGNVRLAEEQSPVNLAGTHWGEPGESSYKYEPECAFAKPATDVVLIGHAYPSFMGQKEVLVSFQLGPLQKTLRISGDRYWVKSMGSVFMTPPEPFERMPLTYERSFGGWDRSHPDAKEHAFEPRNPVGAGFRSPNGVFEGGVRLPNLEDPMRPVSKYGDTPPPAGFGFTCPNWQPRAAFAGTYGDAWLNARMPALPADFDRRFFSAASMGLKVQGFLEGNEWALVQNATPQGRLSFQLPAVAPPECAVRIRGGNAQTLHTVLDTVIVNTDEHLLFLIWRANMVLRNGPEDVLSFRFSSVGLKRAVAR